MKQLSANTVETRLGVTGALFCMLFCRLQIYFKNNIFKKLIISQIPLECQTVKFGSRSSRKFCQALSGNGYQQLIKTQSIPRSAGLKSTLVFINTMNLFNSFLASHDFCHLQLTYANTLDPNQDLI